ncbi:uncharacterized protein LOC120112387 [Phoenix dactylifera]|uniref:Uncharacterized protein LOC120112387 n=1 Tax=Phoenix dactylifera TaxID=42345 RepID=A0A8B9AUG3_PHODC|nr:uncharacterized protein LOC120112387 [Phoenix dactylifera]
MCPAEDPGSPPRRKVLGPIDSLLPILPEFLSPTNKALLRHARRPAVTPTRRAMEVGFCPSRFSLDARILSSPPTHTRGTRARFKAALTPSPGASPRASSLSSAFVAPFVGGSVSGEFSGQKLWIPYLSSCPSGRRGKRGVVPMVVPS